MKIVFNKVPVEFAGDSDHFEGQNGVQFYTELEMQEEQFVLTDTCGRSLPFDYSQLDDLLLVLTRMKQHRDSQAALDLFWLEVWKAGN